MKPLSARFLLILVLLLLAFPGLRAFAGDSSGSSGGTRSETIAALDSLIPVLMAKARIPGLSVALIWDGELAWAKGYGTKDKATGGPVDEQTVFEAASLTKPFFAALAMTLADSGILDLDKPLIEYVRRDSIEKAIGHSFDHPGFRADWFIRITARMVLSHSSGLPHGQRGTPYPVLFEPGSKFSYSADGYYFLQKVVESRLKEPLGETMRARVLVPLHMDRSSMVWDDRFGANIAVGHTLLGISNGGPRKYTEANAAASLYTTAADYARFVAALMNGSFPGLRSAEKMLTPVVGVADSVAWSLGFGVEKSNAGPAFFQWGDYGIFRNYIVALRGPRRALVYLTNSFYGLAIGKPLVALATGIREDYGLRWLRYEPYESEVNTFLYALAEQPVEDALRLYHELRQKGSPVTGEYMMNTLGYELLRSGALEKALRVFEVNINAYPGSANTYDSMGEACETSGDHVRAAAYYQKALDVLPTDTTRNEVAKGRLHEAFQKNLARVKGGRKPD